jgi:hypothetical protein
LSEDPFWEGLATQKNLQPISYNQL